MTQKDNNDTREFKPRFTKGKCTQCRWYGHGARYTTGIFICTYCDKAGSEQAATQQKDWWLKTGRLR